MDEEPHLQHIHLRAITDTLINPGLHYFYGKQEEAYGAHE